MRLTFAKCWTSAANEYGCIIGALGRTLLTSMAADGGSESDLTSSFGRGDGSQETAYIPVRVLGRGAFGEAVLYRKVEVSAVRSSHALGFLVSFAKKLQSTPNKM